MGCFSFLCKKCGRPINSDSHSGQRCVLFLLEEGRVIEEMRGQYDSYGRVFDKDRNSIEWQSYPWSGVYVEGERQNVQTVCDLMHNSNPASGIAAFHERCCRKGHIPATQSESDPEQGWGRYARPKKWNHTHVVYGSDGPVAPPDADREKALSAIKKAQEAVQDRAYEVGSLKEVPKNSMFHKVYVDMLVEAAQELYDAHKAYSKF